MVQFNAMQLRELCRRVDETDDARELIELADEIIFLINEKRHSITLARRRALKVIEGGKRKFNVTGRRAA
jgi:hypothetical protein